MGTVRGPESRSSRPSGRVVGGGEVGWGLWGLTCQVPELGSAHHDPEAVGGWGRLRIEGGRDRRFWSILVLFPWEFSLPRAPAPHACESGPRPSPP